MVGIELLIYIPGPSCSRLIVFIFWYLQVTITKFVGCTVGPRGGFASIAPEGLDALPKGDAPPTNLTMSHFQQELQKRPNSRHSEGA